jgi:hypothetical protein
MIPERVEGQGGAADQAKRGERSSPPRTAFGVAARVAVILACATGLGLATSPGCGQASPIDSAAGNGDKDKGDEPIGQGSQSLVSTQSCLTGLTGIHRPGSAPVSVYDTQIINSAQGLTQNFGASQNMNAGVSAGVTKRALLQFDLSQIPSGPNTNITSATLNLTQGIANTGPSTITVRRITAPWATAFPTPEGNNTNGVTWTSFGSGYDAVTSWGSFTNASSTPAVTLNGLVASWVHGSTPNYGLLLEAPTNSTNFWSSEYGSVTSRPSLNVCFTVTCNPGFADCNASSFDGCETDLTSTATACGACNHNCTVPNAVPACVNSACAVGACNLGFADCNNNPTDGCETVLTTNANCGGCGVVCALPGGTSSCASGTCTLTACNPGHYDCDGNPSNGCEATPCVNGSHCATSADCTSGVCVGGFCATPVCSDGVQNGVETAVDCGGGSCPPCAVGLTCNVGSDCTTGVCTGGVCQAAACNDGVKNGAETSVDCGGGTCPTCATGQACLLGADCTTGVCTGGICQAAACNDGVKNGNETSVDCGGGVCTPCAAGKNCNVGTDCVDLVCQGNVCQLANCTDGVQNGAETDVDCGGTCQPCNVSSHCTTGSDCASLVCQNGFCQAPTCTDGVKNGNETGTDCGGSCFKPEVCNGIDDDCNGLVDDGLGSTTCGVGACQVTIQNCISGQPQTCVPLAPQAEICDGLIDDDCDGVVDNGCSCIDGKTQSCYTGTPTSLGVGPCTSGVQTCAHGQWGACVGEVTPVAETCDGIDNDCNGQSDDGLGQTVCGIGACQSTTPNCLNGLPQTCTPRPAQTETCDGIDNDCNGVVDDNLPTITCGVGACQRTVPACANGVANVCVPGAPSAETCDGIDNDCDGVVDNGNPGGAQTCTTGNLGVCSAGTTACTNGTVVCNQNVQPSAETCDGLDNDCDGVIDNGNPGGNAACNTGNLGICSAGTTACSNGAIICNQNLQPTAEACDGLDNDCDGQVDNGNPGGGVGCSTGNLGLCAAGTTSCSAGTVVCNQNQQPTPETCDGLDNDCDGVVDNGNPGGNAACGTGHLGVCSAGTTACTNGAIACNQNVQPHAETCDGLDNDCDGVVDNGNPGGNLACNTGHLGICAAGVTACTAGQIACNQTNQPHAETCNGLDDDCDGQVDNGNPGGNVACNTGHLGICSAGTTVCSSGQLACTQNQQPHAESCNGLDDDCDGVVDNGNPGGGLGCSTGLLGVCSAGTTSCTSGAIACNQNVQASTQLCNGLDENCNGIVDEGCNCLNGTTQPCYGGAAGTQNVGVCHGGTQTCVNGNFGACVGQVLPSPETCDGVDNDCNGQVDDALGTISCGVGQCGRTVAACVSGHANTCTPGAPVAETCDGLDNDCDGVVDNGNPGSNVACNTGHLGVCAAGLTTCQGGAIACIQQKSATAETCDGLDNDCDGVVDNGNPGGGVACGTGLQGVCSAGTTACSAGSVHCNQNIQSSAEVCDGLDNNCNGTVDEGVKTTYYRDADGDGYGNPVVTQQACSQPVGYVANNGDCNDNNALIHPGAPELCNGIDDNCNGTVDEGVQTTYYRDADGDTYGNPSVTIQACSVPAGYVANSGDCNDNNAAVHPNATEVCNLIDDNCNGQIDEGVQLTFYRDADGDGYGNSAITTQACTAPAGYVSNNTDCNDGSAAVHPGAVEVCNLIDDNCDGQIDEGVKSTFYRDADGDGFGNLAVTTQACTAPTGYVANSTDCNDSNAAVKPTATEVCNGIDDNCNGQIDEGVKTTYFKDADGDTYGNAAISQQACTAPVGYVTNSTDCDDTRASVHPGAIETCNGLDDNCNGTVDEGVKTTFFQDADNDTYGNINVTTQACSAPVGYVLNSTDCDDTRASVHPGAAETCNGLDDNCNGTIDEGVKNTYYRDSDGDGYGNAAQTTQACTVPVGYVTLNTDCDDTRANVHPGAAEVCDGLDNNCNGTVDEGVTTTFYRDADGDGFGTTSLTTQACSAPTGYVANNTDCNDGNAAIHPGAADVCDLTDNNCDGVVDNALDEGFGNSCGAAQVIDVAPGEAVNMVGTAPSGINDYIVFHFINDPGTGNYFHPMVNMVNTAGGQYQLNAQSAGCGANMPCGTGTNPGTVWEMLWTQNPNNCGGAQGACFDSIPHITTAVARVVRVSGSATNQAYQITASNCNGACGTVRNAVNYGYGEGNSNTCGGAAAYEVQPGGLINVQGHLPNVVGNSEFFQVAFQGVPAANSGAYYHPKVFLAGAGANEYLLNVDSPSCGAFLSGQDRNCNGVGLWEMSYPSNPNNCQANGVCTDQTGKNGNPWVQVVRVASGSTCSNYVVQLSNQ